MQETARRYQKRETNPLKEVETIFAGIEGNPLNAYVTLDHEGARAAAGQAEQAMARGVEDLLLGIPIAVKDNICARGIRTTCSSDILKNFVPTYDAFVIQKLKERGAVILGKTNLDEFAMGSTTTTSNIGPTLNPWDRTRTPGDQAAARLLQLPPGNVRPHSGPIPEARSASQPASAASPD